MLILKQDINSQDIRFIPRSKTYDSLFIIDESTGVETQVTIDTITTGDYFETITATFTLLEDRFYNIEVKNGSNVVYKDRVFCTNQSINTYSINNGKFTENNSNNDFIIYE